MSDEIKDVAFYPDAIIFTDNHVGGSLYGRRLRLDKETRKLVCIDDGKVISESLPGGECDVLFGEGWKDRGVDLQEPGPEQKDMVDKPAHYSRYGIETIDALRGTMSPEEFNGFLKGNAFKYLTRAGAKDALEQDLHKVCWYTMFLYLANGGTVEALGKTYEYMKGRFTK